MAEAREFGKSPDGERVEIATIAAGGMRVNIISWGAIVQDVRLEGYDFPLVLGSNEVASYWGKMTHFGAIAGPVANRVRDGRAPLGNQVLQLDQNEKSKTMLHGGFKGLSRVNWRFVSIESDRCVLAYDFADGVGGLVGNLAITAEFIVKDASLEMVFRATTDQLAFCNLAHHGYWNLDGAGTLANHRLQIFADSYLAVDGDKIPVGAPEPVAGGRFDYRVPRPVWSEGEVHLDHNFCLDPNRQVLRPACLLQADELELLVSTTEPGLQVYDGYMMNTAPDLGLEGRPYEAMAGIALEPQKWPDAPNHSDYPSILISPESPYFQRSEFQIRKRADQ